MRGVQVVAHYLQVPLGFAAAFVHCDYLESMVWRIADGGKRAKKRAVVAVARGAVAPVSGEAVNASNRFAVRPRCLPSRPQNGSQAGESGNDSQITSRVAATALRRLA